MKPIINRAPNPRKIPHNPNQPTRAKRAFTVLTVQAIRHFPTLEKASSYLAHRAHPNERYSLHQTTPQCWTVSRVIGGQHDGY